MTVVLAVMAAAETEPDLPTGQRWFSRDVAGIGGASFLADLGHEVPTALLPTFLTSTLHVGVKET
jgi:hypothetical protein